MKKTFLLCVGAQKSGTTWLYKYLSDNESVNFGPLKEYHIWDGIDIKECAKYRAKEEDKFRHALQNISGAYEYFFSSLIKDNVHITGDITPSYSGLTAERFKIIRNNLERSGFDVKVIFLMRDPFERCWSAVRMARRNGKGDSTEAEQLRKAYKSNEFILRTNYKSTINAIELAFEKGQIYYGLYEELFNGEKIKAISDFCGVAFNPDYVSKKFNVSPKLEDEAMVLKQQVRDFYSEVYEFCLERFPQTKDLW